MSVDETDPAVHELVPPNALHQFLVAGDVSLWKTVKELGRRFAEAAECDLSNDPRVDQDVTIVEEPDEIVVSRSEVVDPDGCIDDDHATGAPLLPPRHGSKLGLGPTEPGEPTRALPLDERAKSEIEQGRPALDARQAGCLGNEVVVDIDRCPHEHLTINVIN